MDLSYLSISFERQQLSDNRGIIPPRNNGININSRSFADVAAIRGLEPLLANPSSGSGGGGVRGFKSPLQRLVLLLLLVSI